MGKHVSARILCLVASFGCAVAGCSKRPSDTRQKQKTESPPAALTAPPGAQVEGGIAYRVLEPGRVPPSDAERQAQLRRASQMRLKIAAWNDKGELTENEVLAPVVVPTRSEPDLLLSRMQTGATWLFWVPKGVHLPLKAPDASQPDSALYRLTLQSRTWGPEPPTETEMTMPASAVKEAEGWRWVRLNAGDGKEPPDVKQGVVVHISAWSRDGNLLSSNQWGGDSVSDIEKLSPPPVKESVLRMVQGERRRLWLPAELSPSGEPAVIDIWLKSIDPGYTVFPINPEGEKLVVRGQQPYLFRKGTHVKQAPKISPTSPAPR